MSDSLRYKTLSLIDSGEMSETYKVERLTDGKILKLRSIDIENAENDGFDMGLVYNEVKFLTDLTKKGCNNNILCYYESFFDNDTETGKKYYNIVTEYIDGVTLSDFIDENPILEKNYLWPMMIQLLIGLSKIHKEGYAHRNINPDTIMIDTSDPNDLRVVYSEFELSCKQLCKKFSKCENGCSKVKGAGNELYFPQFYYHGTIPSTKKWTKSRPSMKHDIWALGMTFYFMTNKSLPYDLSKHKSLLSVARNTYRFDSNYEYDFENRTNNFIKFMMADDFYKTPSITTCYNTFISDVISKIWN